jgi:hypothetical protein
MIAKLWTLRMSTDGNGDAEASRPLIGRLLAVDVDLGDLVTPDITITDEPAGTTLLAVSSPSDGDRFRPTVVAQDDSGADIVGSYVPAEVLGSVKVVIASGGANKTGTIKLLCER